LHVGEIDTTPDRFDHGISHRVLPRGGPDASPVLIESEGEA
jgi:hypothetical protein